MSTMRSPLPILLLAAVLLVAGCGSRPAATDSPAPAAPGAGSTPAAALATYSAPGEVPSTETDPGRTSPVETAMGYVQRIDTPLARVNGQEITWEYYEPSLRQALRMVSRQGNVDWNDAAMQQRLRQLQNDVLTQTVDRWLLRKIAADQGIIISEAEVRAKIESERAEIQASALYESWAAYLQANGFTEKSFEQVVGDTLMLVALIERQQVDTQEAQVHLAHIALSDNATAQEVVAKLKAGEDFARLAAQYSSDEQTKDAGGDLGWLSQELMLPELVEATRRLEPGQFSDAIPTRYGFTVLTVLEREMREADASVVAQRKQAALMAILTAERARAEIEVLVDFQGEEEHE
jgi:parvulin-like peptidyl-prolyl isomerase